MSASLRRLGRLIGIILIFSVVGPLAFAALTSLIVVAFGAALLQLLLAFVDLSALRPVISIAVWLLAFLAVMASIPPSAVTGLIFASAAVYAGIGAIWMAWLAAAVAIAGVVTGGMFFIPSESSAVILPSVGSASQALPLFAMLAALAVVPTSLCWWLAKPLHRATDIRMNTPSRIVTPERRSDDVGDTALRPQLLSEFVGQAQARANLSIFIEAARKRGEALDHVLFVGPPGLGKTTLAQIVARELGVGFRATSGPVIAKAGDLAALLTNLEERDVLFIDEIHRLSPAVEEVLYPAMEDFQLDLIIGEGPAARSVKIELAKFTLVGATTRAGLLTNPLRDRFGIPVRLNFYTVEELEKIVTRGARVLNIGMTPDGSNEIARRARGTPRIAGRLLRRVRDFASAADASSIDRKIADQRAERARGRCRRSRRHGPALSHHHRDELRRRPGRRRNHGGGAVGAARRHRGHHRAVPDPVRLSAAHPARAAVDLARVQASRPRRARARSGAVRIVRRQRRQRWT